MKLWIDPENRSLFNPKNIFEDMSTVKGEVFRVGKGRVTLRFNRNDHRFFLKRHTGVGWKEIFKELFQGRLPVIGALNEWRALERLQILNISSLQPVACGQQGYNPAKQTSFLVTQELTNTISLEDLVKDWQEREDYIVIKRAIIRQVARLARRMHNNGINHRDMYICHIHVSKFWLEKPVVDPELFIIDLHRAQIRRSVPYRWQVKDIASLYYSSLNAGLTNNDIRRFMRAYNNTDLLRLSKDEDRFVLDVQKRSEQLCNRCPPEEDLDNIL